jgi:hypothetical protein
MIILVPPIGRNIKIKIKTMPYFSKASCQIIDFSTERRFRNTLEPSSGGIGKRLNTPNIILI